MPQQRQPIGTPLNVRVPLIGSFTNRDYSASKDQRFINAFPETRKVEQIENTKIFINKRPGLTTYKTFSVGEGRGIAYFNNKLYVAIGDTVWEDDVTPTSKITLTGTTGKVGMVVGNSSLIGDYLFVCDGTAGWIIDTSGTVTNANAGDDGTHTFPTPHAPVPTWIDGYMVLAKGSDIYTCTVDEPTLWLDSDFISAESFPDPILGLARQNNKVVALGSTSIEFFYDAANASGSPLSRNEAAVIQTGCISTHAIYQNEKYFAFIGQSDSGGRAVWFVEGFSPKKVSDEFIDRILDQETDLENASGFGFRSMGHMFYLVNLVGLRRTLVYDVDEKLWHEWSNYSSGAHTEFICNHETDTDEGAVYLLHGSDGDVYKLDPLSYQDGDHGVIRVEIITNRYDMDTYKRKFMSTLKPVGDLQSGGFLYISWSDDDYQTWTTTRQIDLSSTFPNVARLGSFRRRTFKLVHEDNYPLRLEALDITYTEGIS